MGIEQLKKLLAVAVDVAMVVDKLVNKEGLFSIFQFSSELGAISGINVEQLKQEIKDLSDEERKQLEEFVKAKLVLHNQSLEAKIEGEIDVIEVAIGHVQSLVADVKKALGIAAV